MSSNGTSESEEPELLSWEMKNPRGHSCTLAVTCGAVKGEVKFVKRLILVLEDLMGGPFDEAATPRLAAGTVQLVVGSERTTQFLCSAKEGGGGAKLVVMVKGALLMDGRALCAATVLSLHTKLRKEPTCATSVAVLETLEYLLAQFATSERPRTGLHRTLCRSVAELEIRVLVLVSDSRFVELVKKHELSNFVYQGCEKTRGLITVVEHHREAFTVVRENATIARIVNCFANHRISLPLGWKLRRSDFGILQFVDPNKAVTKFDPRLEAADTIFSTFDLGQQRSNDWLPQLIQYERKRHSSPRS